MLKCVLIYNPNSGRLTNRYEIKRIYKILENYGYDTEIKYTEYKGHAKEMTKKLKDVDLLLCAGGDGTLNEVISGNIERKKPILLGHLPLGSVNDVAHMYGMTNNTFRNIVMLLHGAQKNIDVCLLNNNPFVYVACIGAFVDISYATPRKLKEKFGKLAYVIYGIKQLKQKLQHYNVKYTVDGVTREKKFSFIFLTNSCRLGGMNFKNILNDVKLSKSDKIRYIDSLTSLKNRKYLNDNISKWDSSQVYPQSIIIIDLNNVAYINDNFGHSEGDKVIALGAGILINNQLSDSEIVRTNGNEFLIFTIGHDEKIIISYIRKLNKEFKELSHGFGAAIGYSMINDEIKTIDDAINEATIDMRNNKEEVS